VNSQTAVTAPASGVNVALEPGARVHHYELIRELGRGGMGVVFAARDTKLGRRVAIKFVPEASRALAERFLIEAQATAQCTHDNIVIIHEVDDFNGVPYMVLEFLEGKTLRDLIDLTTRVPAMRTVELMVAVARALSRAHDLGVVHRDLKPENVFVTTAGQVKVLDFGIAKAMREGSVARDTLPEAGLVGTLAYMSPEQLGADEVDERSDVWAAGIMMFEMLSGHHPIEPATFENLVANASAPQPMRSLRDAAPDVPDELAQLVDACLAKHKAERPTSQALVRALELLVPNRAGRVLAEGESPYPGLTSFQEGDADRFFGRDREVARMVARIRELPLTGVVGPSGAGKSSFVRAGVGPALKASGERWEVFTVRPGRNPLAALASVMLRLTARGGAPEDLAARLLREPGYLGELLRTRARETNAHYVLFVDQLEELYTLVPDVERRRAFTAALAAIADDVAAPLRVVVSMRSDFLDRVSEDTQFADDLSRGLVFLATPDAAGLREALVQPIELVGYRFETDAMIDDMLASLAGTPGALPLLQFAASLLWDARDRDRRLVTAASYAAIGGISGALATHADDVVAQMNAPAQKLTQQIFRALVTPERTRAIVELADLLGLANDRAEVQRVIDQLVAARLLVVQTRGGGGSVEIVHESLIERWPTLRRWLDEDQEDSAFVSQVSAAAKQWHAKGRAAGLLWRGDALDDARRYMAHRRRELPERERAFVAAALALARRGQRMRLAAVVAGFALLAAGLAGAIASRASIQSAREDADRAAANATDAAAQATRALDETRAKERERAAAEAQRQAAEATAQQKSKEADDANTQIQASREELIEQNKKLATTAREAQRATEAAQRSASDAQKAQTALQQALDRERARVKALEDERKKLSTQLKD
jgi:Skp family chaperone for outer membrane proteins